MDGHAYAGKTGESSTIAADQGRSRPHALLHTSDTDQLGLVPRCLGSLFDLIDDRQGAKNDDTTEFSPEWTVAVSFLQVCACKEEATTPFCYRYRVNRT